MVSSFKVNPMIATDSYKLSHKSMYPKGTTKVYSNMTPRSGKIIKKLVPAPFWDDKMVHVGLQALIKNYVGLWNENFFKLDQTSAVSHYAKTVQPFLGSGEVDVEGIVALHKLGYLPLEIKALPEGSVVPYKVPVFTITNTVPEFFWLTNYTETYFSNEYWKGATAATIARYYRKVLDHYAEVTGAPKEFVTFQAHDFSCRGMGGMQDSAKTGIGHLVFFQGSDTVIAADYIQYAYGCGDLIAASVPATEHSIACSNILTQGIKNNLEAEKLAFKRIVTEVVPNGIVSYVSDTFDFWGVLEEVLPANKDAILNRGSDALGNSKVVVRPDSGDPYEVICGCVSVHDYDLLTEYKPESLDEAFESMADHLYDKAAEEADHGLPGDNEVTGYFRFEGELYKTKIEIEWNRYDKQYYYADGFRVIEKDTAKLSAQGKGAIEVLWETFGGTINEKGYKVLNPKVGLIYGDSITLERADKILKGLKNKGFCSSNVVFGVGSFTYQYNTRDTLGFAVKATYCEIEGKPYNLFKDPKTDSGTKKSAKGLLQVKVDVSNGEYVLNDQATPEEENDSFLKPVFFNGWFVNQATWEQVREEAKKGGNNFV